ncbi:BTAD domain-containing putative transcriptional regulator [Streptomyces sp. NPDC053048]|uniref:AfsR/SARP family transcriptional regulator n=1 Tax=Streptomyces sp. NPDC053048 TaxID=3365694 RepID=UPI0037CE4452
MIAVHEGRGLSLGPPQRRTVLALLTLASGRAVTVDALRQRIWDGTPPASATSAIQVHVHHLRRVLAKAAGGAAGERAPRLVTHPGQPSGRVSYALHVPPDCVDVQRFRALAGEGEAAAAAGDMSGAIRCFDAALALWRGEPLLDAQDSDYIDNARHSLRDLRLDVGKRRAGALLSIGAAARAATDLWELHAEHPADETVVVQLARALCASGATGRALELVTGELDRRQREYGLQPAALVRQRERIQEGSGWRDES